MLLLLLPKKQFSSFAWSSICSPYCAEAIFRIFTHALISSGTAAVQNEPRRQGVCIPAAADSSRRAASVRSTEKSAVTASAKVLRALIQVETEICQWFFVRLFWFSGLLFRHIVINPITAARCVPQRRGFPQKIPRKNLAGWFLKNNFPQGTVLVFSQRRRQLLVKVRRGTGTCEAPCILDYHCRSASH